MKIIIIPNEPNPNMSGRHYGVAKALIREGHEVHTIFWDLPHQMNMRQLLAHLVTSLLPRQYQYEDIKIHKISRLPLFWPIVNGWIFRYQIRSIYHSINADFIFTESYTNETEVPKELPFIYDLADDYAAPADVYGSAVYKIMFKLLQVKTAMARQAKNANAVTTVSDILSDYAKTYNPKVNKVPNGVESSLIKNVLGKKYKSVPSSIIYVSGFGEWSRPIETMKAVLALKTQYPNIKLTLVGEGSEVSKIRQFIAENSAEDTIEYLGFIHNREKVFELISRHEIGLNISDKNKWRDAAHPMKVIEYSALGKKVVSTNLAGVTALNLPNVFLFGDSHDDITSALNKALQKNPSLNTKTVITQMLEEYDWQKMAQRVISIAENIIDSKSLEIYHVTPSYPPNLGGLEKVVSVLARTERSLGHKVSVLTSRSKHSQKMDELLNIRRLSYYVIANTIIMPTMLWQALKIKKLAVVHLHITQAYSPEVIWIASKLKKFKYIAHIHLDIPPSGRFGFLLGLYKKIFLKRVLCDASFVIVFTNDQKQNIHKQYQIDLNKIKIIPNGVEKDFYIGRPRVVHTKPRLLFVGRIGYQKNLRQLLRGLEGVSESYETTLVGDGDLTDELITYAKKIDLKNINFVGRADGDELINYYRNADVFVLTSEREGMPLVLLEAMAMGLPIIATNVTGNKDVVENEKNGLLIPYDDHEALANALKRIKNPEYYRKLSTAAIEMAQAYSWEKIANKFIEAYREA